MAGVTHCGFRSPSCPSVCGARFFFFIEQSALRAGVRTKMRMRESLARSRCSQMVKKKPFSIKIDLAGMLANIYTVCCVGSLIS